jgi:hypothetical protein
MSTATIVTECRVERWFYIGIALAMIVFNMIGFAPALLEPAGRRVPLPLTTLVAAHGIVSAGFLFVFLAQTMLVATGRTDIHRRLGIAGAVLGLAFIVLTYFSLVENARRGFDLSGDVISLPIPPGASIVGTIMLPLILVLTFGLLLLAALCYRHRPDVHKRLMVFAVLGGLTATPVAHISGHWPVLQPWSPLLFPLVAAIVLALPAFYDRRVMGRIHPVSLWVPIAVFVLQNVIFTLIVPSAAWSGFAAWLIQ